MTADVSPDDRRPPTSIRDSGGSMPFSEADFTRDVRDLVAEGDRVPAQRDADSRPIEPAGTVIEVQGSDGSRMQFVSNGHAWIRCVAGPMFLGFTAEWMNRTYAWWLVAAPDSVGDGRMRA